MRRPGYLLPTCALLTICLAACSVLAADGRLAVVAVARQNDRITWTVTGNTVRFDVYSPSGIGRAVVRMVAGPHPAHIVLRLHLAGLEELRFAYGATVITVAVASTGDHAIRQQVVLGAGEEQVIAPDSPYWMQTKLGALTGGYIEVELPPAFLRSQQRAFSIAWIDFFR
jgi:hypothetical protein